MGSWPALVIPSIADAKRCVSGTDLAAKVQSGSAPRG